MFWHASTTPVHVRDRYNTEVVVVGDRAAELRPHIYPRKYIYNDFLGSATSYLFCFCLGGWVCKRTCAQSSRRLASHGRSFPTSSSLDPNFCIIVHCSQAFLGRKRHFKHQRISSSCTFACPLPVGFIATSASLFLPYRTV